MSGVQNGLRQSSLDSSGGKAVLPLALPKHQGGRKRRSGERKWRKRRSRGRGGGRGEGGGGGGGGGGGARGGEGRGGGGSWEAGSAGAALACPQLTRMQKLSLI